MTPQISRERLVSELADPALRLVRLIAPAGFGKTTVARALLESAGSRAVCDLAFVNDCSTLARSIVTAAASGTGEDARAALSAEWVALGRDEAAWCAYAEDYLARVAAPLTICFENAEAIVGHVELIRAFERILRVAPLSVRAIVCARVDPGVAFGRFAGPDATRAVGPEELRFDREEIARIFAGLGVGQATLKQIETFTRGWPIVVVMLYMLAKRGRIGAYLGGDADVADLYGYLAGEVDRFVEPAERELLEAIAAIPDASESDLRALCGDGFQQSLDVLERETPYVSRTPHGAIEVHPAMRQMLARRSDPDRVLAKLYERVDRSDGGLRAAQVALHRGRPADAVAALSSVTGGYLITTPSSELNAILAELPGDLLVRHPQLWTLSGMARGSARDPAAWIDEGERVLASLDATTPPDVAAGVVLSLANAYFNRGRFKEADDMVRRFATAANAAAAPLAGLVVDFCSMWANAYRGQAIDLRTFDEGGRLETFMRSPATRALIEYDVFVRQQRILGRRSEERATSARAVDLARGAKIPLVLALCLCDASFGAWFAGEDALHARYVAELEAMLSPSVERGFRHYIACARGTEKRTPVGTEKMKTRAHAFVLAASVAREAGERRRCAQEAIAAADHSGQPFAQIIARVALALIDPPQRERYLSEARQLGATTCSKPLQEAIDAVLAGDARGSMLEAFARRFEPAHVTAMPQRARALLIRLAEGDAVLDGQPLSLSDRELEVLTLLAVAGRPLDSATVAEHVWPDSPPERAAASLKVYASRLRTKLLDPHAIVADRNGYRLNLTHTVAYADPGETARRVSQWDWLPPYLIRSRRNATVRRA